MKKILLFLLLLLSTPIFATTYPWDATLPGIVAGWHMNENTGSTTVDTIGLALSTCTNTAWVSGVYGSALSFPNAGYAKIGDDFANLPFGASPRSVGYWYKWDSAHDARTFLFMYGHDTGTAPYFAIVTNGNNWGVELGGTGSTVAFNQVCSTETVYTHLIISYDGNKAFDIYVNGTFVQTVVGTGIAANTINTPTYKDIGGLSIASVSCHMSVDDLAVTNTSMTATTALNWYNGTAPATSTIVQKKRRGFVGVIE